MDEFIDMHCHILPDVDDGAENFKEMVKMLKIAYSEGIRCIIATPHHHPLRGQESPEVLRRQAVLLRDAAHKIDEKFRIYLGSEVYFGQDVPQKLKEKKILTMNKRNYVLLEFSPSDSYDSIRQGIQQIQFGGYQVILAHVERYLCIVEHVSCKRSVLRVMRVALVIVLNVTLYKFLVGKYIMNSWSEWIMYAVIASVIALVTTGFIYFITEKNQFLACLNMVFKRKVKHD